MEFDAKNELLASEEKQATLENIEKIGGKMIFAEPKVFTGGPRSRLVNCGKGK
ncbi:hypothetical protein [Halorussus ruber]|uniref:hypothetical protein n=1 Tax=Halorussus ruber TaxID=1126238 RepID=UPI00143DE80A|nr:hypothetical protein [Halorussus ruber]